MASLAASKKRKGAPLDLEQGEAARKRQKVSGAAIPAQVPAQGADTSEPAADQRYDTPPAHRGVDGDIEFDQQDVDAFAAATNPAHGIPESPPAEAFKVQPPPKVSPWHKNDFPPTRRYPARQSSCPIDWDYIRDHTPNLREEQVVAYECRRPWVPKGKEVPYEQVKDMINAQGDTSIGTLEGARKRFGRANLAIFKATGVYFEDSVKGLEGYGIKPRTRAELERDEQEGAQEQDEEDFEEADDEEDNLGPFDPYKDELDPDEKVVTFILKPPKAEHNDRCIQCCEHGLCYDENCRLAYLWHHGVGRQNTSPGGSDYSSSDSEDDDDQGCPIASHSPDRWTEALAMQRVPFGCRMHQPLSIRWVHHEKLEAVRVSESEPGKVYLLNVSTKAFDIFTSCFAPDLRSDIPQQLERLGVYLNQEDRDNDVEYTKTYYVPAPSDYAISDILEAYCCSQALECPLVSDVILGHLSKIVHGDESLTLFEPKHIDYVFQHTGPSDPIRLFFLDVFRFKMDHAKSKMTLEKRAYPFDLVQYWDYWNLQQQENVSPEQQQAIDRFATGKFRGHREAQKGLIGVLRSAFVEMEYEENPDNPICDPWMTDLQDQEGLIWEGCFFDGWAVRMWEPNRLNRRQLHVRFTQTESVQCLAANDQNAFCRTYHNHHDGLYDCYMEQFQ